MNESIITLLRGMRTTLQMVVEPLDLTVRLLNNKRGYPPLRLRQSVGNLNDFEGSGGEYLAYLKLLCDLRPGERLLDIGCGCGLITLDLTGSKPLMEYLGPSGWYVGMDTDKTLLRWGQRHTKYPNCWFRHIDAQDAKKYAFPFEDRMFDVILLKSVFTHLLPGETENYLKEIKRLLSGAGRCLATFFLLNETSDIPTGRYTFKYRDGPVSYERETKPKLAVAYKEDWLAKLLNEIGLAFDIYYGTWLGRQEGLSFQDVVVMRRHP